MRIWVSASLLCWTAVACTAAAADAGPATWSVATRDDVLEIAYGPAGNRAQVAALHLKSGYFRMVPGRDAGWGTSVVLVPSFWEAGAGLRQGAPVKAEWAVEKENLRLSFTGRISELDVKASVLLSPPGRDGLSAEVAVTTKGRVALQARPGEAFKPVMLSSMHESDEAWDSRAAIVEAKDYTLPGEGWILKPAAKATRFGLRGGSSAWKKNAPTMAVALARPMAVTGWVTPSKDPNDDNVGLWAASDEVLGAWSYVVTSRPGGGRETGAR